MPSRGPQILAFNTRVYGTLKEAEAQVIFDCGGEVRAAELCRVSKSRLSDCANPYREADHLAVDVVKSLESICRVPSVTAHLAADQNCVLLHVPPESVAPNWHGQINKMTKETCEAVARAAEFIEDGDISKDEAPLLLKDVDEALVALASLRDLCVQKIAGRVAA